LLTKEYSANLFTTTITTIVVVAAVVVVVVVGGGDGANSLVLVAISVQLEGACLHHGQHQRSGPFANVPQDL
jgi:hypothetical protein